VIGERQHVTGEIRKILPRSGKEAIGGDDVVAIAGKPLGEVRTDESGSAGDRYTHLSSIFVRDRALGMSGFRYDKSATLTLSAPSTHPPKGGLASHGNSMQVTVFT
jgi:hypothetical protein